MNSLAGTLDQMGEFHAAEELYVEAMDIATEHLGPNHQDTLAHHVKPCIIAVK
jgi:hypothetical protein